MNKNLTMKNDYMENTTKISDCRISVIVVIDMENSRQPYISMSPYTISFLHNINAELIFNIWGYDIEED